MIAIRLRAAWCLIGLLIVAAPVQAAVITVDFAGTLTNTNIPGIAGNNFSGSFTVDNNVVTGATLAIPPDFSAGPVVPGSFMFEVIDGDDTIPEADSILIEVSLALGVAPWPGAGSVIRWSVELRDEDGTAFPPLFPPSIPAFGAWDVALFSMTRSDVCGPGNEGCFAEGVLSSFQSVPEPATLPLLIAALGIGLWFAGRRRRQAI